jgi:hypothetical protein
VTLDLLTFFCLAKKKVTKKRRDQNMLYTLAEASPHFGQASAPVTLRHSFESTHSILAISVEDKPKEIRS